MGGKVAIVLALHHPELVNRLVVVDISCTRESFPDLLAWILRDASWFWWAPV